MAAQRLLLPLLALLSALLTGLYIIDIISTRNYESACEMTWSWPVYSLVSWRSAPSHAKYHLFRVDMKSARNSLLGVPVLFVPGHMGSYKQARSLSRHLWDTNESLFDLFALDLNEEPTGLNGNYVTDQAMYLNAVVRSILKEYKRQNKKNRDSVIPHSVVIVAHSMGGIVVRTAALLPNYKKGSIQHVVALGVPFDNPSFPFDTEMSVIYDRMRLNKGNDDDAVYVSIAGGHKDILVQTSLTSVDTVADSSGAFVALASAIPTVQTSVDHFCLLWCHQLLKVVAESLYNAVDLKTRGLVSDPSYRLEVAKNAIFGEKNEEEGSGANDSIHRVHVRNGYYPGEYATYTLLLPQFLTSLMRMNIWTVLVIMYAITLQISYAQMTKWQSCFDRQSNSLLQHLSHEKFPSFLSMLHPAAHAPIFLVNVANAIYGFKAGKSTIIGAALTLGTAVAAVYFSYGKISLNQMIINFVAAATTVVEIVLLYAYAIGLLYVLTKFMLLLQHCIIVPVVSKLSNITDRFKVRRWMIISIIHLVVQLVGQLILSLEFSRVLVLLVLASFVVFVLYLLTLGGNYNATLDQQHMQNSLLAVLLLSVLPWTGKVTYFFGVIRSPIADLSNDLLMEGGTYVVILNMLTYLISLSLDCMVPLPPTAFFGASSGQDAASVYEKSLSNSVSSVKITAENCPKCIFEDGGPGSILVEFTDRTTQRVVAGKTSEVIYVGPTFRVVACDCVYRFKNSRDFCDFCKRSCRFCGGGIGNYQEAAKYDLFLKENRTELALHALVPMMFQMCAVIQATYGLHRAYMSFYLTPACVLALIIYHKMLRHPFEAQRHKNEQCKRRKLTNTLPNQYKGKSATPTNNIATPSTSNANAISGQSTSVPPSRNKKKKKRQQLLHHP
ncbi:gpi inositol-deacylase [Plasmopara halstedii]|uniref:GPI inositol-deacylase n=1 Tax=Plasmopara halstedii TaxID=4781 RepID=A0A0N7L432_PLAHL|nr:gpi inositol-deacylase [Plasmopara halstedii]CEG37547.1 gpi inositol-deacylase [Plasmopara halstedii]|eukprot:XP_024573916.1 gpi inositol-deacylase [Plasmopara halstedii]